MAKKIKDMKKFEDLNQTKRNLAEEHRFQNRLLQYLREESERLQRQVLLVKENIAKIEQDYKANEEELKNIETYDPMAEESTDKQ